MAEIDYLATIEEAQHALDSPEVEALCVPRTAAPLRGVTIQDDIDNYRESAS